MPRFLFVAALAFASAGAACGASNDALRVATTTTVDNSGLLQVLVPAFTQDTGIELHVIATGSGQAFNLARRGDVALLMTHEPAGERALIDEGIITHYRKVMFNHFVIAGPADDPADVRRAASAADAMRRIAESGTPFISRGDESGTHVRERRLWTAAGVAPAAGGLLETGQGMGPTLRVASERQAYVLSDEGTLAQLTPNIGLETLFRGDRVLLNTYAVSLLSTTDADATRAGRLAEWLVSDAARRVITTFAVEGRPVFFPWPAQADATQPESLPVPTTR